MMESHRKAGFGFLFFLVVCGFSNTAPARVGNTLRTVKNIPSPFTALELAWSEPTSDTWCIFRSTDKTSVIAPRNLRGSSHTPAYQEDVTGSPAPLYFFQVSGPTEGCVRNPDERIYCGDTLSGDTTPGFTMFNCYVACTARSETGPEYIYEFHPVDNEVYVIDLSSAADLDLLVLHGAVDDRSCIQFGDSQVLLSGSLGERYYLVVDGNGGAAGPYQISVTPQDGDCGVVCRPDGALQCATPLAETTAGGEQRIASYDCIGLDESGPERIYRFVASKTGAYRATLSNLTADLDLFVLSRLDDCSGSGCIAWGDTSASFDAVQGEEYYIMVDGRSGAAGPFTVEVDCPVDCAVDGSLTCNVPVPGDTTGGVSKIDSYNCTPRDESGPDHIYTFTAEEDGLHTVSLSNLTGDLDVFVLSALDNCSGNTCIAFGDDHASFDALPGATYYIVVDGFNGAEGRYQVTVECPDYCFPDGNLFCRTPLTADTTGGRSRIDLYNCTRKDESGPDHIYEFVAESAGLHTATLSGLAADLDVLVLSALDNCSGNTCIAFGDNQATFTASPGVTYTIVVDGSSGRAGSYAVTVDCPLDCVTEGELTCGSPVSGTTTGGLSRIDLYNCAPRNESGPDKIYRFTAVRSGLHTVTLSGLTADLDVFILLSLDNCSGNTCLVFGDTSASFNGVAGTTYYVVVDGFNGAQGDYTVTIDCPVPSGCDADQNLDCETWTAGSTVGSHLLIDAYDCSDWPETGPEYIYRFVAPQTGQYTAIINSTADLDVFVVSDLGDCSGADCIDFGDSSASFTATAGETYYIIVDGFQGAEGPYQIKVDCPPTGPCAVDEGLPCNALLNGDTTGGFRRIDNYDCVLWDESGPDYIYSFTAPTDGTYDIRLTNIVQDLDVFVLSDLDNCGGDNCIGYDGNFDDITSFDAVAGGSYWVIVDGYNGAFDTYSIQIQCPGSVQCLQDGELRCNTPLSSTTIGGTSRFTEYDCWPMLFETGPDKIYKFIAKMTGTHTATISGMTQDLDIFVLSALDNCSGNFCLDGEDSSVSWDAVAGQIYWIIVDGWNNAEDNFTVEVTCP